MDDSFVTRKPAMFTLVFLFIILLMLIPVYFYTKSIKDKNADEGVLLTESYSEVNYLFDSESDLSESDKKHVFILDYENNIVRWTGVLVACDKLNGVFRVSVDHTEDGSADVVFSSYSDCREIEKGSSITYKTRLIEWNTRTFVGKDGEFEQ